MSLFCSHYNGIHSQKNKGEMNSFATLAFFPSAIV
nr:MAG TPA: hypothetical protein [Caudoviricetes sp.]